MDAGGAVLVALVVIPSIAAILVAIGDREWHVKVVVLISSSVSIILALTALLLMVSDGTTFLMVERSELGEPDLAIVVMDILTTFVLIYVGYSRRNISILLLASMILITSIFIELLVKQRGDDPVLMADHLAVIMLLITNTVGAVICIYALGYMSGDRRQNRFFAFMLLFISAMNGAVVSNDLVWLFMFWEVTTLCSYMLISHDATAKAYVSAERALVYTLIGGLALSSSFILIAEDFPTLEISVMEPSMMTDIVVVSIPMIVIAALAKSAQLPFQSWLVGAMVAPTPVSALLHSATMVNLGAYLVLRFWHFWHFYDYLGWGLVAIGSITFLSTSIFALRQSNSKRVLAYSTIGNLGLVFVCAGIATEISVAAGVLLLFFHSIAKALLFLAVGMVKHTTGSEDIEDMQELRQRMPLAAFSIYAGVFLMVFPPFGLFVAKWMLSEAAVAMPAVALVLAVGLGATTAYYGKWLGRMYMSPSGSTRTPLKGKSVGRYYSYPILTLIAMGVSLSSIISLVIGGLVDPYVTSGAEVDIWGVLRTDTGAVPLFALFIVMGVCFVLFSLYLAPGKDEMDVEYTCGEPFQAVVGGAYLYDERAERWGIVISESTALALIVLLLISPYLDIEVVL